jgi:hypothetical protein
VIAAQVDWAVVASLATALGTLVLAIATFTAIRSANANARTAERSLLAGLRPVLFPSRDKDPTAYVAWGDRRLDVIPGGQAVVDATDEVIYFAANLRNVGTGIAVLHSWQVMPLSDDAASTAPDLTGFRRLTRDLYIPPDGSGFWQGAIRVVDDPDRERVFAAFKAGERLIIDLLYGDLEGGQRTISRFSLNKRDDAWRPDVLRHWHIDRPDPR